MRCPGQASWVTVMVAVVCLGAAGGCRFVLGPDDARPPPPDADDALAVPDSGDDAGGDVNVHRACDLRLQDCASKQGCYPDEAVSGDTVCLPRGSGGPLAPCTQQGDCDARLLCLPSPADPAGRVCVELCRPGADVTGCAGGVTCVALPSYDLGTCRY